VNTPSRLFASIAALVAATAFANDRPDRNATVASDASVRCTAPFRVGYRIVRIGQVKAALWYPTSVAQRAYPYPSGFTGQVAHAGEPLTGCEPFPLVVFSHGLGGCGIQSIFFTETLARQGYVVVAPDHRDASLCSIDGRRPAASSVVQPPPLFDPTVWNSASYVDRRNDIERILDAMLGEGAWGGVIARDKVGIVGHSMGGYVALGMVGGWKEWKDPRLRAALLFSPYSLPLSIRGGLRAIDVPVMYQGGDLDIGITTFLEGPQGAYAQSNAPKYFAKLRGGHHFTWTNLQCADLPSVAACIQARPEARWINAYGIAFLDQYLKGRSHPILRAPNPGLSAYLFDP
jgi:predicted dienelactone hydrolase